MSTIDNFNRIEDCDKIDAKCIDAYIDQHIDEDEPTTLKLQTSWGDSEVDLESAIKTGETLTTMYLSPDTDPNCLVYEPERGDNICIHGDDLSRIISMTKLKDVRQDVSIANGDVYLYNGTLNKFEPFDLATTINNINTAIQNLTAAIANLTNRVSALETTVANHENRLTAIETLLTKPTGVPNDAKIAWGTINLLSDPNAVINSSGAVTSLDKTHGLYTHDINTTAYGDEILG